MRDHLIMTTIRRRMADLAQLRDQAKVQAHLGSMEARQEWDALEAKWSNFAAQARLVESAEGIRRAVDDLGEELRLAYQRLANAL